MEKYKTYPQYLIAKVYKNLKRHRIAKIISWEPLPPLEEGCTAILGMCSRIPHILGATLQCLNQSRWEALKAVVVTVDAERGCLPSGLEEEMIQQFPQLNLTFYYYNQKQARLSASISDPYIYSWLSWSISFNHVRTRTVLIQDYDALVLDKSALEKRYNAFIESGAKIQGIAWSRIGGVTAEDRLATTFEAFVDVNWIRSFPPIMGYNRVGKLNGRKVDYDTYLDIQANHTPKEQRTMIPMALEELVHPSNMITQYMRFRNTPNKKPQLCFSLPTLPFFYFLSGQKDAIIKATQALEQGNYERVDLLGDGVQMNLSQLNTLNVDFLLKQSIQVCLKQNIEPFKALIDYGTALYQVTQTPSELVWVGDFTPEQRSWIEAAKKTL